MAWFNLPTVREPDDPTKHNEVVMVMQYQAGALAVLAEYSPEGWINAQKLLRIGEEAARAVHDAGVVSIPKASHDAH